MTIATKRGDDGTTGLMYGHRVPKTHPRVAASGAVDELNAAIGIVRVVSRDTNLVQPTVRDIQKDLITLMGELSIENEDRDRYQKDGFPLVDAGMVSRLTALVDRMESEFEIRFKGWAIPGEESNLASAQCDVARTVCRRSERELLKLHERCPLPNPELIKYLNRLSDVLWLLARYEDCIAREK